MMKAYSPCEQYKYAQYPERCILGKAPVLGQVKKWYGSKAATTFLMAQLIEYNMFVGVKEEGKNTSAQIEQLAQMILGSYAFLKLTDFMLFFYKLKQGEFGKTYGTINPQDIMIALRSYMDSRNYIIERYESEQREKERREHAKRAITREQWEQLKKQQQQQTEQL